MNSNPNLLVLFMLGHIFHFHRGPAARGSNQEPGGGKLRQTRDQDEESSQAESQAGPHNTHGQVGTNMVFMPGHKCQFPMHVCHYLDSCLTIPHCVPFFYTFIVLWSVPGFWTLQLLSHLVCRVPLALENRRRRRLQLWACLWLVSPCDVCVSLRAGGESSSGWGETGKWASAHKRGKEKCLSGC